jgi:hypothetical protein
MGGVMRYAIFAEDGVTVENVIVADEAFCEAAYPGRWQALAVEERCDIGEPVNAS